MPLLANTPVAALPLVMFKVLVRSTLTVGVLVRTPAVDAVSPATKGE